MPRKKCSSIDASIGKRLKFYRIQAGLTQQQMADALSLDRTTYTKYETGMSDPSTDIMGKIVEMLGVDYNALLSPKKDEAEAEKSKIDTLKAEESGISPFLNMNTLACDERDIITGYRALSADKKAELQDIIGEMLRQRIFDDTDSSSEETE